MLYSPDWSATSQGCPGPHFQLNMPPKNTVCVCTPYSWSLLTRSLEPSTWFWGSWRITRVRNKSSSPRCNQANLFEGVTVIFFFHYKHSPDVFTCRVALVLKVHEQQSIDAAVFSSQLRLFRLLCKEFKLLSFGGWIFDQLLVRLWWTDISVLPAWMRIKV